MIPLPAIAQERTLFDFDTVDHGGYGAVVAKLTSINNEAAMMVGGRGGWIVNHMVAIGGGGYGLVSSVHSRVIGPLGERFVQLGYGGLDLEIIVRSDELVHFSVHTLVGGGSVGFRNSMQDDWFGNHYDNNSHSDGFFVAEPGINLDLNVTPWFRASAGVTYRYVGGLSSEILNNVDLRGPSGILSFRFGKF